jgi:pyruvate dehydrogenase E2 component (dihydrolipoamide acetyltransferase)
MSMQTVVMPKMGDTMEEGKILTWRKQEGDTVERGDALAEIETEKTNIEAESFTAGVLRKILVPVGQTVPVGTPIALVGAPSEAIPPEFQGAGGQQQPQAAKAPAASAEKPSSAPGRPTYSQGQAEVAPEATRPRVVEQPLITTSAAAPLPVTVREHAGDYAPAGPNGAVTTMTTITQPATTTPEGGRIFISPIARRIAQEHQVDIARIHGTGPNGRIIKEDVEAALETKQAQPMQPMQPVQAVQPAAQVAAPAQLAAPVPAPQAAQVPQVPAAAPSEEYEAMPLSAMRRTIARRLQQSMQTAPHFYVTVSIDTTRLAELRATVNAYTEKQAEPVKISYNDLIVKGVALALRRMPQINVSFAEDSLLFKKHINVGFAVALEQGLIVPVIRDADRLSLTQIARESQRLSEAARGGKLKPEEFQGGTFTVSNLGMFGVDDFTAVINPPEAAILAVAAIQPTPVAMDGQVVVRDRVKVTLSVDHRAIDGATAARFLQVLKALLEEPMGLVV